MLYWRSSHFVHYSRLFNTLVGVAHSVAGGAARMELLKIPTGTGPRAGKPGPGRGQPSLSGLQSVRAPGPGSAEAGVHLSRCSSSCWARLSEAQVLSIPFVVVCLTLAIPCYCYRRLWGPVTSSAVSIVVRDNPVITVQPVAPVAVCQGTGTQVMNVTATGYTLTYQWQENTGSGWNNISNGGVYPGATTNSLTLPARHLR